MTPLSSFSVPGVVVDLGHKKRIHLDDAAAYMENVNRLVTGVVVTVTIEEEQAAENHTRKQRAYWFAVPVPLVADHCGMSDEQASHALLGECFGYAEGIHGKPVPVEPSFAALSKDKVAHAIDWVQTWCPAELEIICPPPDKDWRKHAESIRRQLRRSA